MREHVQRPRLFVRRREHLVCLRNLVTDGRWPLVPLALVAVQRVGS
jgi:hypothetical protein